MATKKINKTQNNSTVDILKNKVSKVNEVALNTSNDIVDETLATGKQWQDLMAKTLQKGTVLFGKQQDMVLSGLEMLKDQYSYGNKRFWKLLSFKTTDSKAPKSTTRKPAPAVKTKRSIDQLKETALNTGKSVKKAVTPLAVKKATPAKATKSTKVAAVKKAVPVKLTKSDLTLVEGVGPKIQELLNNAGIINFDQLAMAKPASLKKILIDAGSRYQMHDPSTWAAQAKLAAAGKVDELKVLKGELKGGK